ncbi:hypothetical protein ACFQE8_15035 [Salinirubellus sp. GCM10025818]|uniref:hypothetical protein n=1 Tax=Salinirubellus TaxID=2162630 RepID=UPI0030D5CA96
MDRAIVITSIHGVTDAVEQFLDFGEWEVVLVGDRKTPDIDRDAFGNLTYLSLEDQRSLPGELHELPYDHYCRKNLGYLYAIQQGAEVIADTDDDNIPKADWDAWLSEATTERSVSGPTFTNVYDYFTDDFVWPRGLPLDEVTTAAPTPTERAAAGFDEVGVVQGLADVEPDVDAIFRLVFDDLVEFDDRPPVVLDRGTYSPFNSQNTLWPVETLYPYLYLPSTVTFRFTDILRGYVAQRGLWAAGKRLAFTGASVVQDRNVHDLMADFESEIPCYLRTRELVETLESLELSGSPADDVETIYRELERIGIVEREELDYLDRWLSAIRA